MRINSAFWKDKRVFVTGHTGFKGAWLTAMLNEMGAKTAGFALSPEPKDRPSLYAAGIKPNTTDTIGDIRDLAKVEKALTEFKPDIIFHMAAQALVLPSYEDPIGTFATNVMGTVHILMSGLKCPSLKVLVNITSDKCYENREWIWPYRENDPMGGHDPYSASKGAAEITASSLRRSFFNERKISLPSVRAGNVIGGGDWALHRIVPDLMQSFAKGEAAPIRNPQAIRPWQHVLEPLRAYLMIAEAGWADPLATSKGWNVGPDSDAARPVLQLAEKAVQVWGDKARLDVSPVANKKHEATFLKLDTNQIRGELGWRPLLNFDDSLEWTVRWYRDFYKGTAADTLCKKHVQDYLKLNDLKSAP